MSEVPGPAPGRERETIRLVRNLLIAVAVFVVGGLVAVVAGRDGVDDAPRPSPAVGDVSVADHLAEHRAALAAATGTVAAAVSFDAYLDPGAAEALVRLDVESWLVAAPGLAPEVTSDVETWRAQTADAARAEAAELDGLISTAGDPEFERQYGHDRDRFLAAAAALEGGAPVVFGVVVRGRAETLRALAAESEVRLVAVQAEGDDGPPRGLRPEERVVVGQPPERP